MRCRHAGLLVLCSVAAFAGPKGKKAPPPPPPVVTAPTEKVTEQLGDTVVGGVASASKVQVFRVSDSGGLRPDPSLAILSDFVRGAAGPELDAKALETFRSVIYDDKSYRFSQDVAGCRFAPLVTFQMNTGVGTLEALVSFSCNQVLFVVGKPGGRWVPQGTFDIKPARQKLVALVKALFPQDRALQALK